MSDESRATSDRQIQALAAAINRSLDRQEHLTQLRADLKLKRQRRTTQDSESHEQHADETQALCARGRF